MDVNITNFRLSHSARYIKIKLKSCVKHHFYFYEKASKN